MSEEVKHFLISVVCCSCVLDCIVTIIIIIGIIIYSLMNHTLESRMGMNRKGVHNRKQYGTRLHWWWREDKSRGIVYLLLEWSPQRVQWFMHCRHQSALSIPSVRQNVTDWMVVHVRNCMTHRHTYDIFISMIYSAIESYSGVTRRQRNMGSSGMDGEGFWHAHYKAQFDTWLHRYMLED